MSFTEAIRTCFRKYATFSGRAPRAEYWWFQLFLLLLIIGGGVLAVVLAEVGGGSPGAERAVIIIFVIGVLVLVLPSISVTIRRLHDWDKSGWWYMISFVPYVGGLILFIMMFPKSSPGDNRFGPHPYHAFDASVFD